MVSRFITLLFLRLCLDITGVFHEMTLPRPTIHIVPRSIIPLYQPVTIECQAPHEVDLWRLEKEGSSQFRHRKSPASPRSGVNFTTSSVTPGTVGRYCCRCNRQVSWLDCSQSVQLEVADVFKEKLSLSAWPRTSIGRNVTLECSFAAGLDRIALSKDGDIRETWKVDMSLSINFSIADKGTYQCYGSRSKLPYVWSVLSNLLEVNVTVPTTWNSTVENNMRLGMAAVVSMALVEAWCSRKRSLNGTGRAPSLTNYRYQ